VGLLRQSSSRAALAALASLGAVVVVLPFESSALIWIPFAAALLTGTLCVLLDVRRHELGNVARMGHGGVLALPDRRALGFGPRLLRPSFFYLLLACLALVQVQSGTAISPDLALRTFLMWSSCAAVAWTFETVRRPAAFGDAYLGGLLVLGLASVIQHMLQPLGPWGVASVEAIEFWGPFRNRNHLAMLAELIVPFALLQSRRSSRSLIWLLGAAVLTSGVVASGARFGSILLLAEWILVCGLTLRNRKAILMVPVALSAFLMVTNLGPFLERMRALDAGPRVGLIQAGAHAVRQSPYVGMGFGSFETAYSQYATRDFGKRADHAHNDWLEWAVEGGLWMPLVPLAGFASLLLWNRGLAGIIGLGALLAHSLVDYPFHRPAIAFLFLGTLSFLVGSSGASSLSEQSDSDSGKFVR
jgi:hypothetical protein